MHILVEVAWAVVWIINPIINGQLYQSRSGYPERDFYINQFATGFHPSFIVLSIPDYSVTPFANHLNKSYISELDTKRHQYRPAGLF